MKVIGILALLLIIFSGKTIVKESLMDLNIIKEKIDDEIQYEDDLRSDEYDLH